ncbi:regulator of ribonuclease activity A [Paramicrobacterium humi]|uniref:4-hydroxy-4-methyl-2-oxoglutarate aldolase n=1 Tax=Paramicrobacterium humi TaxID=640635 RepID=A0A1H4LB87_9MICO|nr:ribonuclease E activity regulator RraA [Microbacterium humi]SEB67953.1 regulator of ribonuclease activity A [Microbacterium humi]
MTVSTADLWDERGHELASIPLDWHDFGGKAAFSGPARTVRCLEDNVVLKSVVSEPGDGAVLVVDGGGSLRTALLGDMIAKIAIDNGWAGIVINGAVRDRVALRDMPIGIRALASNPQKSAKEGVGEADVEIEIAGTRIRPGVRLFADEDGVLVER